MRLTGWILLLIGALACATIAWAAIGFLLMGVGLIALQVAERRRRRADVAPPAATTTGFTPPVVGAGLQPPVFEPVPQDGASPRLPRRMSWPAATTDAPYDREEWRRLVESDSDLAQIANVLADYGPQYVDELAASYLALPDKSRLGAIVEGIIARARDTQQPAPPPAPPEPSRPPPLSRPVAPLEDAAPKATTPSTAAPKRPAPPPLPASPADALEASLIAAVEASAKTSAKAAAERGDPPSGGPPVSPRGAFGRAAREERPDRPPPPAPAPPPPPTDFGASLIAAVTDATAKPADPPKPVAPPEPPPSAAKPEPEVRRAPGGLRPVAPPPAPPPKPPTRKSAADDLDESLLAALAEISGQKHGKSAKPEGAASDPDKEPPADDELSEMIKKFAPDSSFLRKQ